ncbi:glucose-dependent insulinotropic receptor-like [Euwallacea fornicatus]|uniref:glucose-dependent insulinotropic receptor-like n=1 Tax=Euwallacea fornicatus TaxID=995702 RepID=UPI00338FFE17
MFVESDNTANHVSNMGNSFLTATELEDPEVNTYLSVYDYVIPVVATFIILINLSVVVSSGLLIQKKVEPRFTYLFLGNVAMTDMITGLSVLFGQYYPRNHRNHSICAIQMGMIVSSTISSIYSVGLLGVDRFLYIVYGIKYCKLINTFRVRGVIGMTWFMALIIGFLPLMGWAGDTKDGQVCWFIVVAPDPLIILTVSIGLIPIILVMILYSIILYHAIANIKKIKYSVSTVNNISEQVECKECMRVFRGNTELSIIIKKTSGRRKEQQNQFPNKWKAVKIVLFTTMSFLLTWSPYFIACVIYVADNCNYGELTETCKQLRLLIASPLSILGFSNSLINPLIYAWWHNGFRSYIRKRLKMCCR